MNEQEIRVKALDLTIQTIALMSELDRFAQLKRGDPTKVIIDLSMGY
jgi:hypothetical protein